MHLQFILSHDERFSPTPKLVAEIAAWAKKPRILVCIAVFFLTSACSPKTSMKPDFDAALNQHFAAITNRDIDAFKAHLTRGDTLYTIVQNGYAFTTPSETIAIHEQWFKDPKWTWEGKVIHKVVGENVAMALVRYQYRPKPEDTPLDTWLTYVFELQDGQWRIVHDQNTALDFPAFARANGMQLK
jgi:hypothetical protein